MRFFRRGETLNERLLREAGIQAAQGDSAVEAPPPSPLDPVVAFHRQFDSAAGALAGAGLPPRARHWDTFATAEAPEVPGHEVEFVALPDGTILVEEEEGDAALEPLANAVETNIAPPYRAKAVKQTDRIWAVSAMQIRVAKVESDGETIEVTQTSDGKAVHVDGMPVFGSIPELERIGEADGGPAYAVHAERLDADLWEIRVASL